MLATGTRGLVFARAGLHPAAEEELNAYVGDAKALAGRLDELSDAERAALTLRLHGEAGDLGPEKTVAILQAAGLFARGWNRPSLERKEPAVDDFDGALAALVRAGIENEATAWASVVAALKRGEIERAGEHLGRLAKSPNLDAESWPRRATPAGCSDRS